MDPQTPDQANPDREEEKIAAAVAELYRSERIRFRWACAFCGLASLTWVGMILCSRILNQRITLLHGSTGGNFTPEQFRELVRPWMNAAFWIGSSLLAFLLFFLASLLAWLSAMGIRRREIARLMARR